MAYPTAVNDQTTDSVTQVNVAVTGVSPAMATGNLLMATSQALANAAHNATNVQFLGCITAQTAAAQAVASMLSIDVAAEGAATSYILMKKTTKKK